jgi:integrase
MQTGSIVQRGNFWYLRHYRPVLVNGKIQNRQTATKLARVSSQYPTPDSVRAAGLTGPILGPLNAKAVTADQTISLADFIEHRYMIDVKKELKPKTYKGYSDSLKLIRPYLNGRELGSVKTADIEAILKAVRDAKPRAHSTLNHLKWFLSSIFRFAIRQGLLTHNPVPAAKTPKGLAAGDTYAYTFREVQAMLKVLGEPARTIVLTMILTGLRMSELCGLKWTDIHKDEIAIARQVQNGAVLETKTEDSKALIPLVETVRKAFAKHRKLSMSEYIFAGARDAKPVVMDNVKRREIVPYLAKAHVSWHGWHAFRRGLATELKRLGIDDLTTARLMRHGGGNVTQVHYIKYVPEDAKEAMRKAEKAFLAASVLSVKRDE